MNSYLNARPMLTDADTSQNHHQEHHKGEAALEDIDALRLYFLIFRTERTAKNANIIIMDSKRMYLDCARNAVSKNIKRFLHANAERPNSAKWAPTL